MRKLAVFAALAAASLPLAARHVSPGVLASSHREAPLISQDPVADSTDVYAFVSPDKPDTVTLIANYIGLEAPQSGPNFPRFGDDVLYQINVDNVGDGQPHVSYNFNFTTTIKNGSTFLYNTGPIMSLDDKNWNVVQTVKVTRIDANGSTVLCDACKTPPVNVGATSTPNYDALAAAAINDVGSGTKIFAGQRADPFFVDLGAVFDLLQVRPADKAVNSLKGTNVHEIGIQLPITSVTNDGKAASDPKGGNAVIGVWTAAFRQSTTVLSGGTVSHSGDYVQVSRLGNPLDNELIIPLGMKDLWNANPPSGDAALKKFHDDPEPANLLKLLYKVAIPPTPRSDITAIFLTGVPGLNMPANAVMADELRLNLAIPVAANPNRLGVLANDTQGFPNGRRLNDDVVDIEIQALAGATYPLIDKTFTPDPLASKLGDGVDGPAVQPLASFPYEASPYAGTP